MVEWLIGNGFYIHVTCAVGGGFPDMIVGAPWGEVIFIECKAPGGRLTAQQKEWHARWKGFPRCMPRSVVELRAWMERRRKLWSVKL